MAAPAPTAQDDAAELRAFRRQAGLSMSAICREIFAEHGDGIQVRNEKIAVANLVRILEATLALANRKGFAAMSLRDLAQRTGLSLGGLYAYIRNKNDLVVLIQSQGRRQTERVIDQAIGPLNDPTERVTAAIRAHIFLTHVLRPWFQFLYMEARHLAPSERQTAIALELGSEALFEKLIVEGQRSGQFRDVRADVAAGLLKALLQDWYLKPGKHRERGLTPSAYAAEVQAAMLRYLSV